MRAYISEFIGTFMLVFFGAGSVMVNQTFGNPLGTVGIATVFGAVVMTVIYGLGRISGAHINPAVSIAFWVSGRFKGKKLIPYIASQLTGAALASLLLSWLIPQATVTGGTYPAGLPIHALVLEALFTFFLMLVIIFVSTGSKEQGLLAGLSIGGVVFLEAAVGGPLTGASMNPARSFGPALAAMDFTHFYVYIVGPIIGAIAAVLIWKYLKPNNP